MAFLDFPGRESEAVPVAATIEYYSDRTKTPWPKDMTAAQLNRKVASAQKPANRSIRRLRVTLREEPVVVDMKSFETAGRGFDSPGVLEIVGQSGGGFGAVFLPPEAVLGLVRLDVCGLKTDTLDAITGNSPEIKAVTLEIDGDIPASIYTKSLEDLRVSGRKTTKLPDGIGRADNLKLLHVANTSIASLPEGITQLTSLSDVTVKDSLLDSCPPLPRIKYFANFPNNRFRCLPEWIAELYGQASGPVILQLSGNPLASGQSTLNSTHNLRSDAEPSSNYGNAGDTFYRNGGRIFDFSDNLIAALPPWMCKENTEFRLHSWQRRTDRPGTSSGVCPIEHPE